MPRVCQDGHASRQDGSSGQTCMHIHRLIHIPSNGHRNYAHANTHVHVRVNIRAHISARRRAHVHP